MQDFRHERQIGVSVSRCCERQETQDRSYRTTLQIFVEDTKQELRTISKDVEDLNISLQLGEIQDLKINSTDAKLYGEQLDD